MKRSLLVATAALVAVLGAASAAPAAGPNGKQLYRYAGEFESTNGSTLTLTVENGNRPALRSLLGQSQVQTFLTDSRTVFLRWSHGKPTQVGIGDLAAHDWVTVNVRSDRGASLDTIKATAAATVGDRGQSPAKPTQPLYLFRGTFVSAGWDKVTIDVKGGNRHALRLMIGQTAQQSFTFGPETVFLHWDHRIPTVIDASMLHAGDRILIRIRAPRGATLAGVEATPARRVADREPVSQEANQNARS
jgi:hypothetical protein